MSFNFDQDTETVRGLMMMTVYSIIADILNVDITNIKPHSQLVNDLEMTARKQADLQRTIKEMFDNLTIDFTSIINVQDLTDRILNDEFDQLDYLEDYI